MFVALGIKSIHKYARLWLLKSEFAIQFVCIARTEQPTPDWMQIWVASDNFNQPRT